MLNRRAVMYARHCATDDETLILTIGKTPINLKGFTVKAKTTVSRNAMIVGHNSKSCNDKHPGGPIQLRPIKRVPRLHKRVLRLHRLTGLPRPAILRELYLQGCYSLFI